MFREESSENYASSLTIFLKIAKIIELSLQLTSVSRAFISGIFLLRSFAHRFIYFLDAPAILEVLASRCIINCRSFLKFVDSL